MQGATCFEKDLGIIVYEEDPIEFYWIDERAIELILKTYWSEKEQRLYRLLKKHTSLIRSFPGRDPYLCDNLFQFLDLNSNHYEELIAYVEEFMPSETWNKFRLFDVMGELKHTLSYQYPIVSFLSNERKELKNELDAFMLEWLREHKGWR